jgi:hypothetical protein
MEIPIIGGSTEQKLVITFSSDTAGTGHIGFHFEPDFDQPRSPEEIAAMNVANAIIQVLGLNKEGSQNAESTDTTQ